MIRNSAWIVAALALAAHPCIVSADEADKPLVESHPGISLEPMYSEAVIDYNSKQPAEALKVLDRVLRMKPDYVQALELKALVLKGMGKPEESRKNYEALIQANPDRAKAAPYHFELGVIEFNAKHLDVAQKHFQESLAQKFNEDASHFFLGIIAFGTGEKAGNIVEAEHQFEAVAHGSAADLKPAAHYYLGLINYKKGQGSDGTHELIEARSLARDVPDSPIARDIEKAVNTALAPYGKGQLFGNFSFMGGYNGNANSGVSDQPGSGISTGEVLFSGSVGWMSSPLSTVQWVASYRLAGNYNFAQDSTPQKDAGQYSFLAHTGDLYLTKDPLARTQYGFKLEGSYMFNDDLKDDGTHEWAPFSYYAELGPYVRHELKQGMLLSVEGDFHPVHYSNPNYAGVSGSDYALRSSLSVDRSDNWWNPTYSLTLEDNQTQSAVFTDFGVDLGVADLIRIDDRNTVIVSAGLNTYWFSSSGIPRTDKLMVLDANLNHKLTTHWSAILDVNFTDNFSTDPDFSYTRPIVTAGVSYLL
jgi:tetratricopeptide (TPR) repeat protein